MEIKNFRKQFINNELNIKQIQCNKTYAQYHTYVKIKYLILTFIIFIVRTVAYKGKSIYLFGVICAFE